MNPERGPDPEEPLDIEDDLFADELCDYMTQLDLGGDNADDSAIKAEIPAELQSTISECRSILDFLHETRSQSSVSAPHTPSIESFSGFTIPVQIGRFKIIQRLGFGGYGVVFRGFDSESGRDVAIKVPRPELLESAELIYRFAREASIVAQLAHPNIVSIYESDCYGVVPYIVMAFIPGKTLSEWRQTESAPSPRIVATIARDLAMAVAHAHERGVLHRDLKPGNVILASRDSHTLEDEFAFVPILTDFGIAQYSEANSAHTRTGAMIGTMRYMSPEQAQGRNHEITRRTDVYGLGTILYQLLTGLPPFRATNHDQLLQNILHDTPVSPRKIAPEIPIELEVICLKCLEKNPTNRYRSAEDLTDDLRRFLSGDPIRARPASAIAKVKNWIRRYPARAVIITTIFVGLIVMTVLAIQFNRTLIGLLATAESERTIARENERQARHHELISRNRAYCTDMRNAKRSFDRGNLRLALGLLERYSVNDSGLNVRDFAWSYLWRKYNDSSQILGHHHLGTTSVAVTRLGNMVASGGDDGSIRMWSIPSQNLIAKFQAHEIGPVESVTFSPDGLHLASAGADEAVRVWDVATLKELFVCRAHKSAVMDVIYTSRGHLLASAGGDGNVRLWNPVTGEPEGVLSGHTERVLCLAAHPAEDTLVSGGADGTIRVWNLSELSPDSRIPGGTIRLSEPDVWIRSLAFEPNGQSFVAGATSAETIRFSLDNSNYGKILERQNEPATPLSLTWPKGGALIAGLGDSEIRIVDRFDPELPGERHCAHFGAVFSIAAPADGSFLVSASQDGDVRIWPKFQSQSRIVFESDETITTGADPRRFSVQWRGSVLAADLQQEQLSLFRMPERKLERTFPKSNDDDFAVSPHGKSILIRRRDGLLTCFQVDKNSLLWRQQIPPNPNMARSDTCAIDRSESFALVTCENELIVLSMHDGAILHRLAHTDHVRRVQFLEKHGEQLTAVSTCYDSMLRFWDVSSGQLLKELDIGSGRNFSFAISPDNLFLAVTFGGNNSIIRVWRLDDYTEFTSIPFSTPNRRLDFEVNKIAFLEGQKLFIQANSEFMLWDVGEETEVCAFPEYSQAGLFAVSPDNQQLAVPLRGQIQFIDGRKR